MREAIQTALQYVMVLAGVAVTSYRLVDLIRSPRRPAMWAMWSGLLLLTAAVAAGIFLTFSASRFLIQHLCTLGSLIAFEWFYLLSIYGQRKRPTEIAWYQAAMLLFSAGMVAAWATSLAVESPDYRDLDYHAYPLALVMVLCYTAAVGASSLTLSRLSWKWSRIADRTWVRRGLVAMTVGTSLGLFYTVHHLVFTLLFTFGITPPYPQGLEVPVIAVGILFWLVGLSMPALGPRATSIRLFFTYRRSYRELEPLWEAFTTALPSITLNTRPPAWDSEFALYRRAIEIMDGRSRLRGYLDEDVARAAEQAAKARGLAGAELLAAVEAALWRDALAAHAAQSREPSTKIVQEPATGNNLAAIVEFLRLVAQEWQRPSLTAARG
ncbi:MAB_1171c family putative transporter [Amycolatopsis sp. NPDC049688]|uniref:MAB_1171c family putative transporter n=1 Tax=Amycolatopsis sp. NPDC049688 TaxID=3154733 RepID=UPI00343F0B64